MKNLLYSSIVVGEKHTTTAKMEAEHQQGRKSTAKEALGWYVTITDMYGKTIQQQHLSNAQTSIKINTAKGIYLATVYNKNSGKQITTKIVVQ